MRTILVVVLLAAATSARATVAAQQPVEARPAFDVTSVKKWSGPGPTSVTVTAAVAPGIATVRGQAPAGPTFDVVSIKRNTTGALGSTGGQRPDGSFSMTNIPVGTLIARAYPPFAPIDMIGLPGWATNERYDVSATSSLSRATPEDFAAMMRAMLADRFKLIARVEKRGQEQVYDLLVARNDGALGPGIRPSEVDCEAKLAAERAAADAAAAAGAPPPPREIPDFNAPVPPCTVRMTGPRMEGDMTMERLAMFLRPAAGRFVVDRTGLTGSYRVVLEYDRLAGVRGPDAAASPDAPPTVFTAVQEQLGLKLESSRAERDVLVIERLEPPTEN